MTGIVDSYKLWTTKPDPIGVWNSVANFRDKQDQKLWQGSIEDLLLAAFASDYHVVYGRATLRGGYPYLPVIDTILW